MLSPRLTCALVLQGPPAGATKMMKMENPIVNERQNTMLRLVFRGERHMSGNRESKSDSDHSQQNSTCSDSDDLVEDFLKCLNKGRVDRKAQQLWLSGKNLQASLSIPNPAF